MIPLVWFVASVVAVAFAAGFACGSLRRREVDAWRVEHTVNRVAVLGCEPPPSRSRLRLVSPGPVDGVAEGWVS